MDSTRPIGTSLQQLALVLILWGGLLGSRSAFGEDWPQFRGPRRDSCSNETGLLKSWPPDGPQLLWTVTGLSKGYSSPVVADGRVYVTGMLDKTGHVFAFNLSGKKVWSKPYGPEWTKSHPGARSTPTVNNKHIYVVSSHGELVCMKAQEGQLQWRVKVLEVFKGGTAQFGFIESLLVDGDHVFCTAGGPDATLVAFDKLTGETVWQTAGLSDKAAYCSPLLFKHGGKRLIASMTSHHIVGIDADSGQLLWKHPCRNPYGQHPNTPVYKDGTLFCTSGDKVGSIMLKLSTEGTAVSQLWAQPKLDCHHGNVIRLGRSLYGSGHLNSRQWVCLDADSGAVRFESKAVARGAACSAEGLLYCYGTNGTVSLVKPSATGLAVVSQFRVTAGTGQHFAHPTISGGRLYIRRGDAMLVFNIRPDGV